MTRIVCIGGSSGIGLATAKLAAARGWEVMIASRNPERAGLPGIETVTLDVTDDRAVRELFERLGPIDHLVSSTVARASGLARELDLAAARQAFETKVWGPLTAIQAADVRESITLLSGVAASTPMRGGAATAMVNGAVEALVRTLAAELAPLRINAVSPGIIDTPTWAAMDRADQQRLFDQLAGTLPAGRVGLPEDVADAIMLCMTNGFLTGEIIHIDGGHRLMAP